MSGRPDPSIPQRKRDARASPLGRGANPGTSVDGGPAQAQGVAGPRGANVPGERGGAEGLVDRENEDALPQARRD